MRVSSAWPEAIDSSTSRSVSRPAPEPGARAPARCARTPAPARAAGPASSTQRDQDGRQQAVVEERSGWQHRGQEARARGEASAARDAGRRAPWRGSRRSRWSRRAAWRCRSRARATGPGRLGECPQVLDVLDEREARPDREAQDRGVDQEARRVRAGAGRRSRAPSGLPRAAARRSARTTAAEQRSRLQQPALSCAPTSAASSAGDERRQHRAQRDELEAVEEDEQPEEQQDGQQGDGDAQRRLTRDLRRDQGPLLRSSFSESMSSWRGALAVLEGERVARPRASGRAARAC